MIMCVKSRKITLAKIKLKPVKAIKQPSNVLQWLYVLGEHQLLTTERLRILTTSRQCRHSILQPAVHNNTQTSYITTESHNLQVTNSTTLENVKIKNTSFNSYISGEPELASCQLILNLHCLSWASSWDRPKLLPTGILPTYNKCHYNIRRYFEAEVFRGLDAFPVTQPTAFITLKAEDKKIKMELRCKG